MPLLLPSSRTPPIIEEEEEAAEASRTATAVESLRIGLIPALVKSTRREIHPTEYAIRVDMTMERKMKAPDS
jgi:hypothetical protein